MLSYRLSSEFTGEDVLAGLNLYAARPNVFPPPAVETGLLLATHAAAIVAARTNQERAPHLEKALHNSREIGIALGVLMNAHEVTQEQAFDLLRVASQNSHPEHVRGAGEDREPGTSRTTAATARHPHRGSGRAGGRRTTGSGRYGRPRRAPHTPG